MKKFLCFCLALTLLFSLFACTVPDTPSTGLPPENEADWVYIPDDRSYGYYYDCLSEDSKTVYRGIYNGCLASDQIDIILKDSLLFSGKTAEADAISQKVMADVLRITQPAIDALLYDHPSLFFIRMGDKGGSTFSITHSITDNPDGTREVSVRKLTFCMQTKFIPNGSSKEGEVGKLRAAVSAFGAEGESRYDILVAIREKLATRVTYDKGAERAHTAAGSLLDGRAVCDGYAKATKLLCDAAGIPCIIVTGDAVQNGTKESHAWNYVQMEDGAWYAVDMTWSDRGDKDDDTYFLVGSESILYDVAFKNSHLPRGTFSDGGYEPFPRPELSKTAYVATKPA